MTPDRPWAGCGCRTPASGTRARSSVHAATSPAGARGTPSARRSSPGRGRSASAPTAGRSGSRSAPHPGMRARNSSVVSALGGFLRRVGQWVIVLSLRRRWGDERLDAVVELGREHVVALGDVLQRNPVGHDVGGLEVAVADVFEQPWPLPFDGRRARRQRLRVSSSSSGLVTAPSCSGSRSAFDIARACVRCLSTAARRSARRRGRVSRQQAGTSIPASPMCSSGCRALRRKRPMSPSPICFSTTSEKASWPAC